MRAFAIRQCVRGPISGRRYCRGQASVEMAIISMFFLVPFFLYLVIIGKFVDLKSATLQAARYSAFQRTVYSPNPDDRDINMARLTDSQLENSVAMRFYSGPSHAGNAIQSQQDSVNVIRQSQNDSTNDFSRNALYQDARGNRLVGVDVLEGEASEASEPGWSVADKTLETTMGNWNSVIPDALHAISGFNLTYQKYTTANVSATPDTAVGTGLSGLNFEDKDVVLADSWSASTIDYEKDQAKGAVPTSIFDFLQDGTVGSIISGIGAVALPDLFSPLTTGSGPDIGRVIVDSKRVIPKDRLGKYSEESGGGSSGQNIDQLVDKTIEQYEDQGYNLTKKEELDNGSVRLTFEKDGNKVTTTVGAGGFEDDKPQTSKVDKSPYDAAQDVIQRFRNRGYKLTDGPDYYDCFLAIGTTCNGFETTAGQVELTLKKIVFVNDDPPRASLSTQTIKIERDGGKSKITRTSKSKALTDITQIKNTENELVDAVKRHYQNELGFNLTKETGATPGEVTLTFNGSYDDPDLNYLTDQDYTVTVSVGRNAGTKSGQTEVAETLKDAIDNRALKFIGYPEVYSEHFECSGNGCPQGPYETKGTAVIAVDTDPLPGPDHVDSKKFRITVTPDPDPDNPPDGPVLTQQGPL